MRRHLLDLRWVLTARTLARSSRPILLGPWRSEVGFELLYWIPFLTRFAKSYGIPAERLIYLGRGGSAQWFESAGRADLFEFLPLEAVRGLTIQSSQQTGSLKQQSEEAWERHVCALAATAMGLKRYHVLSPKWMYQLLSPFWEGSKPLTWLDDKLLHLAMMPPPPIPKSLESQLPAQFVAMRWYARATWPLKEDLILWTRKLVESVAARVPVVLIDSGFQTDDHADINLGSIPNVHRLSTLQPMTPLNNLQIQSGVIARAQGYVGTYGGMAQGAMRWGVPTLALYDQFGQTSPMHLHLTQSLSLKSGVPFVATYPLAIERLTELVLAKREGVAA